MCDMCDTCNTCNIHDMCPASKLVEPTPEVIAQVKKDYNKVLKRFADASKFWNKPDVLDIEKEKYIVQFRVEVVDVLDGYLNVLKDWGISASEDEMLKGFKI